MTAITFVGIGAIGLPMAARLAGAGHEVTGVDPAPAARARAAEAGLAVAASVREAPRAPLVIVMVATPDQLADLVTEAGDQAAGQTWVIMSTVGPEAVRAQGERLTRAGAGVLDAPVTGGVGRAEQGDLVLFASGSPALIDETAPMLAALGEVRTVGEALGDGQGIKLVNQHLAAVHIVAAGEALHLAESLGLDPAAVLDLVRDGAAGSWMLADRGPRMLMGSDAPVRSAVNIFVKDTGLVAAAADAVGADVPLLKAAQERYGKAAEAGLGQSDDSRVIETYRAAGR